MAEETLESEVVRLVAFGQEMENDDQWWDQLDPLRRFGRTAFDRALDLLKGNQAERLLGYDLIAVLCNPDDEGWSHEAAVALIEAAQSEVPELAWNLANALSFVKDPATVDILIELSHDDDEAVRLVATTALPGCEVPTLRPVTSNPKISARLIELSDDEEDDIRDWATFGLGAVLNDDTPEIRDALHARIHDSHDNTRCEALVGLARRRDPRAFDAVMEALRKDNVWKLEIAAAGHLRDPRFHSILLELEEWWDCEPEFLDQVAHKCDAIEQSRSNDELLKAMEAAQTLLDASGEPITLALFCERLTDDIVVGDSLRFKAYGFEEGSDSQALLAAYRSSTIDAWTQRYVEMLHQVIKENSMSGGSVHLTF